MYEFLLRYSIAKGFKCIDAYYVILYPGVSHVSMFTTVFYSQGLQMNGFSPQYSIARGFKCLDFY